MNSTSKDPPSLYRLAILGDGGVGKTALTIQLCLNQFVETYDPTIEDSYRKKIVLDGQPTTLEVLDTAGQEEYTALRDQWIRDGEGFLLVYSIASRSSFSRIKPYFNQILRVKDGDAFGAVLVGNKSDRTQDRQVAVQEGQQLAKELNIPFYETSAKLNINAETAFLVCARATRDIRKNENDNFLREHGELDTTAPGTGSEPELGLGDKSGLDVPVAPAGVASGALGAGAAASTERGAATQNRDGSANRLPHHYNEPVAAQTAQDRFQGTDPGYVAGPEPGVGSGQAPSGSGRETAVEPARKGREERREEKKERRKERKERRKKCIVM